MSEFGWLLAAFILGGWFGSWLTALEYTKRLRDALNERDKAQFIAGDR